MQSYKQKFTKAVEILSRYIYRYECLTHGVLEFTCRECHSYINNSSSHKKNSRHADSCGYAELLGSQDMKWNDILRTYKQN